MFAGKVYASTRSVSPKPQECVQRKNERQDARNWSASPKLAQIIHVQTGAVHTGGGVLVRKKAVGTQLVCGLVPDMTSQHASLFEAACHFSASTVVTGGICASLTWEEVQVQTSQNTSEFVRWVKNIFRNYTGGGMATALLWAFRLEVYT